MTNDKGRLSQNYIQRMVQNLSAIEKSTGKENKKREHCQEDMSDYNLNLSGSLTGHSNWVTYIATTSEDPHLVLSSSHDTSVLVWTITHACSSDDLYSYACRALCGHSHFVSGVVIVVQKIQQTFQLFKLSTRIYKISIYLNKLFLKEGDSKCTMSAVQH